MTEFTVNPQRVDPYKHFKFRIKWDGKYVAGVSHISGLRRSTDVVMHREGGDPNTQHKSPGITHYEAITLDRGVTHDPAFEEWANKVGEGRRRPGRRDFARFRRDIVIELCNEAGQLVKAYKVYRCWPSRYVALPDLDANSSGVALETLVLENEAWERDVTVVEPVEPKV